jgi:uncharacterized protein
MRVGADSVEGEKGQASNVVTNVVTREKIERYLSLTARALEKARIVAPPRSYAADMAVNFKDMATRYHSDAVHFFGKGDWVNAFAAVNYAHGWLDAGARLGLFDVDEDDQLFTLLR